MIDDATAYGEGIANEVEKTLKAAGDQGAAAREGHRQDHRLEGDPHQAASGRNPDAVFYGGMDATGGPLLKQGARARHQGGVRLRRRRLHRRDGASSPAHAAEGLLCSQAGIPAQAADKKFLDAYKEKFNADPILYAPFTYDAANLLIAAMQKANSTDPAKYLPELQKISFNGATGTIELRRQGRPQGRRDDDLHHEGRQDRAGRGHQGRQDRHLRGVHQGRSGEVAAAQHADDENGTCGCRFRSV